MNTTADCQPEVSVFLPIYNEELRADRLLGTIAAFNTLLGEEFGEAYEFFGVDDGSADNSKAIAEAAGLKVYDADEQHGSHNGKGTAVLAGLRKARGDVRIFTDADGSYSPETVMALYEAVKAGADVAVAHRAGDLAKAHDGKSRSVYHSLSQSLELIAPTGVSDPQAGAKAFIAPAAELLGKFMPHEKQGYGTDRMMLHLARILDLKITEVDAEIEVVGDSHVRPFRVGLELIWEAYKARRLGKGVLGKQIFWRFEPEPAVLNS